MEHLGAWGLIPPFLTILLALVTKDVIISLFLGIFSGVFITAGFNPLLALMHASDLIAQSLNDSWNIRIFLFCALLGGLVGMLSKTGAAAALGKVAQARLKNRKSTMLTAWMLSILIFVDDYFNALAVGTIMKPITDRQYISRAKLAHILDSSAAPVCVLMPISSWVVTIMSVIKSSEGFETFGMTEFEFFLRTIPYNMYALLTLMLIVLLAVTGKEFGPMRKSEWLAQEQHILFNKEQYGSPSGNIESDHNEGAAALDMIFPLFLLVLSAVCFFPVTAWMQSIDGKTVHSFSQAVQTMSLSEAFTQTDASVALLYAAVLTVSLTYIYFIVRKLLSIKSASAALKDGISSMVPALIILTLAWTIGAVIRSGPAEGGLGLAKYLAQIISTHQAAIWVLPSAVFVFSAVIAFSTGTSWGTFTIMIPIVMPISLALAQSHNFTGDTTLHITLMSVAAVLSGAVFGDHASPISDTTILSSTGAGCPHLEHVSTQMPYALFISACTVAGLITSGIFLNARAGWIVALCIFIAGTQGLPKILEKRTSEKNLSKIHDDTYSV